VVRGLEFRGGDGLGAVFATRGAGATGGGAGATGGGAAGLGGGAAGLGGGAAGLGGGAAGLGGGAAGLGGGAAGLGGGAGAIVGNGPGSIFGFGAAWVAWVVEGAGVVAAKGGDWFDGGGACVGVEASEVGADGGAGAVGAARADTTNGRAGAQHTRAARPRPTAQARGHCSGRGLDGG
jgi:hypothetical protein